MDPVLLKQKFFLQAPALMNLTEAVRLLRHPLLRMGVGFREGLTQPRSVLLWVVFQPATFVIWVSRHRGWCAMCVVCIACRGMR
jgi:hypothetical protein